MEIPRRATIVFQGDSITDASRSYTDDTVLGTGYVMMTAAWFSAKYLEYKVTFLNRGISGNRIRDLKDRWKTDCLDLKPDVVSILIGINDILGRYFWNTPTSNDGFERDYRSILEQTRSCLKAQIVLLEPFLLNVTGERSKLREYLNPKIEIVRKIAKEFNTTIIPLDYIFNEAARVRHGSFWSIDGIHPTLAGHALIAQSWLNVMSKSHIESKFHPNNV